MSYPTDPDLLTREPCQVKKLLLINPTTTFSPKGQINTARGITLGIRIKNDYKP